MEIETNMYSNYKVAIMWLNGSLIRLNNIIEIDPEIIDYNHTLSSEELYQGKVGEKEKEGEDNSWFWDNEFYQFFLTSYSEDEVKWLCNHFSDLHFAYSPMLDLWILCVDHLGTSWDYVRVMTINSPSVCELGENPKERK